MWTVAGHSDLGGWRLGEEGGVRGRIADGLRLYRRAHDWGLKVSRLTLARLMFCGGLAITLVSVPLMLGIGLYIVVPGLVLLFSGVILAPRSRH